MSALPAMLLALFLGHQAEYVVGEEALRAGDLERAQSAFQQVIRADPRDVGAHANLGVVFMRRRDWDSALRELKKAQSLAPQVAGIRLNIGLVYFRQGDYSNAASEFESLDRSNGSLQSHYLLGLCYFLTERYPQAYQTLLTLRDQEAGNIQYLYAFGLAADHAGFAKDGKWAIDQLEARSHDSAEIQLLLGKAFMDLADDDRARVALTRADGLNDKLPFLHYYLGILAKRHGDLDAARREFMTDAALEPDIAYDYEELANISVVQNSDKEAETFFLKAVKLEPRLTTSFYGLAKLYRRQGRLHEALHEADLASALETRSISLHYLRGQLLLALNRKPEAAKEMAISKQMRESEHDALDEKVTGKQVHDLLLQQ